MVRESIAKQAAKGADKPKRQRASEKGAENSARFAGRRRAIIVGTEVIGLLVFALVMIIAVLGRAAHWLLVPVLVQPAPLCRNSAGPCAGKCCFLRGCGYRSVPDCWPGR
ncbi:MAG: hypothetical protein MZV63_66710 [Marinilabiliales bacterium]|nr:hypothetical protein [Marinilabiliales bacterium]